LKNKDGKTNADVTDIKKFRVALSKMMFPTRDKEGNVLRTSPYITALNGIGKLLVNLPKDNPDVIKYNKLLNIYSNIASNFVPINNAARYYK